LIFLRLGIRELRLTEFDLPGEKYVNFLDVIKVKEHFSQMFLSRDEITSRRFMQNEAKTLRWVTKFEIAEFEITKFEITKFKVTKLKITKLKITKLKITKLEIT
jgi:hypothetical protein